MKVFLIRKTVNGRYTYNIYEDVELIKNYTKHFIIYDNKTNKYILSYKEKKDYGDIKTKQYKVFFLFGCYVFVSKSFDKIIKKAVIEEIK